MQEHRSEPNNREIFPGLFRIEIPLSGSPLKSINSYVIPSSSGNLVVDTGMRRDECRDALFEGLNQLGVRLRETTVLATHLHADHLGLVGELADAGARILISAPDLKVLESFGDMENFIRRLTELGVSFGLGREEIEGAVRRHPGLKYGPETYPRMEILRPGDTLHVGKYRLEAFPTPGHTPGHLCLWDASKKILLSGDHILGDITPNITRWPEVADSLGEYMESLERTRNLGPSIALTGHRSPVRNVGERIDTLLEHHQERLDEVLGILASGGELSICGIASKMTWDIRARNWKDFPVVQKWFACGEAAAHLDHLLVRGLVEFSGNPPLWNLRR